MEENKIKDKPWLTDRSIQFLDHFLSQGSKTVLELGSGASTIWFAKRAHHLISFEHDIRWYELITNELQRLGLFIDYRFIKGSYFDEINKFPELFFDLILIDGKDRVQCVKNSIRVLKSGGILMLDDAQRDRYNIVNDILDGWEFFQTEDFDKLKEENFKTNWWIKP
jgi:predicted O-methyltransferase YrrM